MKSWDENENGVCELNRQMRIERERLFQFELF